MKKNVLILFCIIAAIAPATAQTLQERVYIKGGTEAWNNFVKEMYLYPSFIEGSVQLNNGQQFIRKMNYNKVLGTIQFIDEKSDTLELANEQSISQVRIGKDVFLYNPVCNQLLTPGRSVKLFKNERLRIADIRQVGALGSTNTSAAIESVNQVYTWMNSFQLNVNETLLLGKTTSFYLQPGNNEIVPASKKNILKHYADKDEPIKEFIRTRKTNFNREADLMELAEYISSL